MPACSEAIIHCSIYQNAQQSALVSQPAQDGVIMSSLLEEEEDTDRLISRVTEIFDKEMSLEEKVEVEGVQRLGAADGAKKPRKVLVTLKNPKQVIAVLRGAKTLRDRNIKAKEAGQLPIGLDRNLSVQEPKYRSSIWSNFKAARDAGKKAWWRGHRLFVDGSEVFLTTS